jgi:NAD(P)-dependent dehydrogenase (short-subunit alcohol dehydrogenase family)
MLAAEGLLVVVADNDLGAAARVQAELGDEHRTVELDVRDEHAVGACFADAAALGSVTAVVCCAGIIRNEAFDEVDPDSWRDVLEVDLTGTFLCVQAAARYMARGSIVTLSSVAGRSGRSLTASYAAAKAGVISLTQSAALALAPTIRVNSLCPGVINTGMWDQIDRERAALVTVAAGSVREDLVARVPLARAGSPDEVAAAARFLLSEDSRYITGQSLNVCGGMAMN